MVELKLKYLVFKLDKKEWKLSLEEARTLFNELNSLFGPKYCNTSVYHYTSGTSIQTLSDTSGFNFVVSGDSSNA